MNFLLQALMGRGGLASLILISFLEASIFPIPPDTLLVPMSILRPGKALLYALIATIFSSLGAIFGHKLGAIFGRPLLEKLGNRDLIKRTEQLFQRYGAWAIAIAGFTPIPFKLATIAAGVFGVPKLTLLTAAIVSRGLRFATEAFIIILLGPSAVQFINRYLGPLSLAVVLLCAGLLLLGRGQGVRTFYRRTTVGIKNILSYFTRAINLLGPKKPLFYLLLSLTLAFTLIFMEIGEDIGLGWQVTLDNTVTELVAEGPFGNLYYHITSLGSIRWLVFFLILFTLFSIVQKQGKAALLLGGQTLGAWLLNLGLKSIYARPRPAVPLIEEQGYSYPSGHAMVGLVFYLALAWALSRGKRRSWRIVILAGGAFLALLIGLSRIYLGVHYPTDVLGGFAAGLGWLCLWQLIGLFR